MIGKLTAVRSLVGTVDSGSLLIVVVGMAVRTAFAAVAWNVDWYAFAVSGQIVYYNPSAVMGIYTGPAYFMAVFYAVWNALPISHSYSSFDFAMKVPSLIFDLLTALLIYRILSQTNLSKTRIHWTLAAWLVNPLTLIAGGFNFMEVIPAFLLLLSSFLAAQRKLLSASVALTAGGLLRLVPFISLPFLLATVIRDRDWKGTIKTALPPGLAGVAVLVWAVRLNPALFETLASAGPGLLRPEVYDLLGVKLSTNIVPYPAGTIAMTALVYLLLLCVVVILPRSQSHGGSLEVAVYLPILAYLGFSFSAPPFLMYGIPFALIQLANLKGYKIWICLLSVLGSLWSVVRSPDYLFGPVSSFFSYSCHPQYWNVCDLTIPIHDGAVWLQTNLQPQITGAFTALLLFIAVMSLTQGGSQGMLQSLGRVLSRSEWESASENR